MSKNNTDRIDESNNNYIQVIVHLDQDIGSTILTNFYRTISKLKFNSSILNDVNENNGLISYEIISHTNHKTTAPPQLLYRGTRDGFTGADFHSRCDNQGPTLTIVKSAKHHQIFGGFTTQHWKSPSSVFGEWISDSSAFIFKIDENNLNESHHQLVFRKFSIKHGEAHHAIFSQANSLPIFGYGHDIRIYNKCDLNKYSYSAFGSSYELPIVSDTIVDKFEFGNETSKSYLAGSHKFKVLEIEVFKIII